MIGVFDSGFGGLTILKEFTIKLPKYDYIYLGDNLRTPYGGRSQEAIYQYTEQGVDFLFKQGCELIIIACNSASAKALKQIQQKYLINKFSQDSTKRVLGVIRPLVEHVVTLTKNNNIGLLATKSTVSSDAYDVEINKLNTKIKLYKTAAPLLVPLIEEGWTKRKETRMILKYYLRELKKEKIDTLILGCTHYPLIYSMILEVMGKRIQIPHPGWVVANSLENYLQRHPEIETKCKKNSKLTFYTTDYPEKFNKLGSIFLGKPIKCKKVIL